MAETSGKGRKYDQKMKPFLVYQYLMRETDEEHFANAEAISEKPTIHYQKNSASSLYKKSNNQHHYNLVQAYQRTLAFKGSRF